MVHTFILWRISLAVIAELRKREEGNKAKKKKKKNKGLCTVCVVYADEDGY